MFAAVQAGYDAEDVVVLDEFGTNSNITPRYARSSRGECVYEQLPRNTPHNTTTLASLSTHGIGPSLVMNGSLSRAMFEAYIQDILGPTLREGQVIVLDNARASRWAKCCICRPTRQTSRRLNWRLRKSKPGYGAVRHARARQ